MPTVKELRKTCKDQKLRKYSHMRKAELINYLNSKTPTQHTQIIDEHKNKMYLGIHVFKGNDIADSIKKARNACPLNAIQIHTHGPRSRNLIKHDYARIKKESKGLALYVHSSYPTNPWKNAEKINNKFTHTVEQFVSSRDIGSKGVVLHIPKIEPSVVAPPIKKLADVLLEKKLLDEQKIILEMIAVKQHETKSYESPEKINRLIEYLIAAGLTYEHVGICIDTAHIYAGKADIHTYASGLEYCRKLKYPKWIYLIHLNGNVYDAKKRAGDKHAVPFDHEDKIWKGVTYKKSGCRAFIEYAKKKKLTLY